MPAAQAEPAAQPVATGRRSTDAVTH
jgi:hypothetical protein